MYLIAIVVAFIGLWISSEVQAGELCGLRISGVFSVDSWDATRGTGDTNDYMVVLKSQDNKSIKAVGGRVEFFLRETSVDWFEIDLKRPIAAGGVVTVKVSGRNTPESLKVLDADKNDLDVLACVDSIEYSDGSGMIIN